MMLHAVRVSLPVPDSHALTPTQFIVGSMTFLGFSTTTYPPDRARYTASTLPQLAGMLAALAILGASMFSMLGHPRVTDPLPTDWEVPRLDVRERIDIEREFRRAISSLLSSRPVGSTPSMTSTSREHYLRWTRTSTAFRECIRQRVPDFECVAQQLPSPRRHPLPPSSRV
jgi:hypothetical protein